MYKNKKILAIIPARGGSKGLPNKNIKLMNNIPLIGWTIKAAKNTNYFDDIFVSTDSKKISVIAENFGISVPNLRPAYLAKDSTSSVDVVLHVLNELGSKGKNYDYVALLEPTSPLRRKNDLTFAIKKLLIFMK